MSEQWNEAGDAARARSHRALNGMVASPAPLHSGWPGDQLGPPSGFWRVKQVPGGGAAGVRKTP